MDWELVNADCVEYMKGMADKSVDFVLTDIPYGEANERLKGPSGFRLGYGWKEKGKADAATFGLDEFLSEVARVARNCACVFCGIEQAGRIISFFQKEMKWPARHLVWEKTNPVPVNGQYMYLSGHENAVWAKRRGAPFYGRCKSSVLHHPVGGHAGKFHPTEKSHALLKELIEDNTLPGELVFDPCAGSGSSLLVAIQNGRRALGCELDRGYWEKARERLERAGFQNMLEVRDGGWKNYNHK